VEADLRPMNLGLAMSKRRAQDRSAWRKLGMAETRDNGYVYDKLLKRERMRQTKTFCVLQYTSAMSSLGITCV